MGDVVHTGYLELCKSLTTNKGWKRRFFVLKSYKSSNTSALEFYKDGKKDFRKQDAKGVLNLVDNYQVEMVPEAKAPGKRHVFDIKTVEATYRLAADGRDEMDTWTRHLQMQTKLKPTSDTIGIAYHVQPVATEANRRLGATDECIMQMSRAGIKLALHPSGSLVAEWPLQCIRHYACEEGKFKFQVGRKAPLGEGLYVFQTADGDAMFEVLDYLIRAAAGQLVHPPPGLQQFGPTPGYHHLQHGPQATAPLRLQQGPPPALPSTLPPGRQVVPSGADGAHASHFAHRLSGDSHSGERAQLPIPASEYNTLDHGNSRDRPVQPPPALPGGPVYNRLNAVAAGPAPTAAAPAPIAGAPALMPQNGAAAHASKFAGARPGTGQESSELRVYGNLPVTTDASRPRSSNSDVNRYSGNSGEWKRLSGPESVARDYDQLNETFTDDLTYNKFYGVANRPV